MEMWQNEKKTVGISGFWLKCIAMFTMLVDHIGVMFFDDVILLRIVGRIAFPIYCFLLVEGFFHTSDVKKYMMRLGIFAIISEIPFNMLATKHVFDFGYQNVFITLFIGLVMIWAMHGTVSMYKNPMFNTIYLILAMAAAYVLKTDYSVYGIAIIYIFYYFRQMREQGCLALVLASVLGGRIQMAAALAVPFIMLYNGKKGPKPADRKLVKYGFYIFYPLHILILAGVYMLVIR